MNDSQRHNWRDHLDEINGADLIPLEGGSDTCVSIDDGHTVCRERATIALNGSLEAVILAEVDDSHVTILTSEGFRRFWSHGAPDLKIAHSYLETQGASFSWSERASVLLIRTVDDTKILVGLEQGERTPCEPPAGSASHSF